MSKNLTKHANYDAFEGVKDSFTAPHAAVIEDENGTIVGYKGEDGDFVIFQNGEGYAAPKHYYATLSDGSKMLIDDYTEIRSYNFPQKDVVSIDISPSTTIISVGSSSGPSGSFTLLKELFVPKTAIFAGAYHCSSLTQLTFEEGYEGTSMGGLWGCETLTSLVLPVSITVLGGTEMNYSSTSLGKLISLEYLEINRDIQRINFGKAYGGCEHLTSITYKGSVSQWNGIAKYGDITAQFPNVTVIHCVDADCDVNGNPIE